MFFVLSRFLITSCGKREFFAKIAQLAFNLNLYRTVIGPTGLLSGLSRSDIYFNRMLAGSGLFAFPFNYRGECSDFVSLFERQRQEMYHRTCAPIEDSDFIYLFIYFKRVSTLSYKLVRHVTLSKHYS